MHAPDPDAVPSTERIAVAVVSWNTRDLLRQALASLRADADAGLADVWVVDNGSSDGSRELVRDEFPWVTLVTPERNLGFGPAVNLVAERTRTRWLVAANADVRLEPGALARLRATAAGDSRVGMVGPRLVLLDGSTQVSVRPFPGLAETLLLASHLGRASGRISRALRLPGAWEPAPDEDVPWVTGAFVLMARAAFDDAGRFDPDQWLYGEDMDLCWRMRARGWSIRWDGSAVAHHAHSAATVQHWGDRELERHIAVVTFLWMLRRRGWLETRLSALVGASDALVSGVARRLARRDGNARRPLAQALGIQLLGLAPRAQLERIAARRRPRL